MGEAAAAVWARRGEARRTPNGGGDRAAPRLRVLLRHGAVHELERAPRGELQLRAVAAHDGHPEVVRGHGPPEQRGDLAGRRRGAGGEAAATARARGGCGSPPQGRAGCRTGATRRRGAKPARSRIGAELAAALRQPPQRRLTAVLLTTLLGRKAGVDEWSGLIQRTAAGPPARPSICSAE